MRKNKAFTLAEVLITLTIIGVIAAITIPNLMQAWKKHQAEVGLKEAYSLLSNAIKMSETENGHIDEWNYEYNNSDLAENKIFPYLKIGKNCGIGENNPCMCNYETLDKAYVIKRTTNYALLANGMSIGIMPNSNGLAFIFVDLDGPNKGACQLGKDVFGFSLAAKNRFGHTNGFFPGGFSHTYGALNLNASIETLLKAEVSGACSTTGGTQAELGAGFQCSAVIFRNSWKIPDNYPVKRW